MHARPKKYAYQYVVNSLAELFICCYKKTMYYYMLPVLAVNKSKVLRIKEWRTLDYLFERNHKMDSS